MTETPLSVPARRRAPRPLTPAEATALDRVADVLIPASGAVPAATAEPGFHAWLARALDARADAFAAVTDLLAEVAEVPEPELFDHLRRLSAQRPEAFQALSTVVAGAWLLTAGVRERIGYRGKRSDKAGLEEAADELSSGILDPVLARDPARWVR